MYITLIVLETSNLLSTCILRAYVPDKIFEGKLHTFACIIHVKYKHVFLRTLWIANVMYIFTLKELRTYRYRYN